MKLILEYHVRCPYCWEDLTDTPYTLEGKYYRGPLNLVFNCPSCGSTGKPEEMICNLEPVRALWARRFNLD